MLMSLETIKNKYRAISLPVKASMWFLICSIINKGIALFTTPIFTRLLSKEEYGQISLYNTWMGLITIIITLQFTLGVFNKAMIKYKDDRDGYTSSMLFLTTVSISIWFILYLVIEQWFPTLNDVIGLDKSLITLMFIDILLTTTWSFYCIRNRFEYKYRSIVLVTIITNLMATILSVCFVFLFPSNRVFAKILGTTIVHSLVYPLVYVLILKKGKKIIKLDYWKYSIIYNLPLIPHYLSQQVLGQSDRIMISNMCGNSDAGMYSLAYQIAAVMQITTDAIHSTFTPWCFRSIEEGNVKSIGERSFQIEVIIGMICLIFSLFAPEFVLLLGGQSYLSAIYIIPPVSMSVLFMTLYSFFGNIEMYFEKTKFIMLASCSVALLNLVLNYFFIPIFGYIAAGYTTLLCYVLYSVIHYLVMKLTCKKHGIQNPFNSLKIWGIALIYVILSLAVIAIYNFYLIRYIAIFALTVFVYYFYKRNKKIFGR